MNPIDLATCPECGADWKYQGKDGKTYSRVIGIEIPEYYDGVSYWRCPDCEATWDRWTGAKVEGELA